MKLKASQIGVHVIGLGGGGKGGALTGIRVQRHNVKFSPVLILTAGIMKRSNKGAWERMTDLLLV